MIRFSNVTKSFKGLARPVLNTITCAFNQGEFCILIGANGCGKSTLLKLITGEYTPDSGQIDLKSHAAQVVQDVNLGTLPEMTLLENMVLNEIKKPQLLFYKRYRDKVIQKLTELGIGLEDYIDQPLAVLSGGQKQLISTLIALNSRKQIVLLDEHTSALDPKMQVFLMDYTQEQIIKHNLTAIMITHKMDDAIKYGNRLIMLHQGGIVLDLKGAQKSALSTKDLVSLFHHYENQALAGGRENDA